jgi:hypothetical protein
MSGANHQGGEYQFRKCGGTLDKCAVFPFNPVFVSGLSEPHILDSPLDIVHSIISILHKEIPHYAELTDNPILIIREIEKNSYLGKNVRKSSRHFILKQNVILCVREICILNIILE